MSISIMETGDGSHTLFSHQLEEAYHSRHGALAESQHVFIRHGLEVVDRHVISVFELGFGTGLNAFLSWIYAESKNIRIDYHSVELYLVPFDLVSQINYPDLIGHKDKFQQLHDIKWNEVAALSSHFSMHKINSSVLDMEFPSSQIDIVFFDAFSPEKQPALWTTEVFAKMYEILSPGGMLVTYCSKSYVRRNMQDAGFEITKLPGPHGKRDMVRAVKSL